MNCTGRQPRQAGTPSFEASITHPHPFILDLNNGRLMRSATAHHKCTENPSLESAVWRTAKCSTLPGVPHIMVLLGIQAHIAQANPHTQRSTTRTPPTIPSLPTINWLVHLQIGRCKVGTTQRDLINCCRHSKNTENQVEGITTWCRLDTISKGCCMSSCMATSFYPILSKQKTDWSKFTARSEPFQWARLAHAHILRGPQVTP